MKRLLILIFLCFIFSVSKSQPNMLGKTRDYIKAYSYLPNGIGYFDKEGLNSDSTTYMQFIAKSDHKTTFRYYFNSGGVCHWFVIMQPVSDMLGTIMSLNESYKKINDNEWITMSNDTHIVLKFSTGESKFTTWFSKIE